MIQIVKLPISVMIVGFNEAKFLQACLESVSFCDEIVYTDLGSTDQSIQIAEQFATKIYRRAKVPSCEMIQAEVVHYLKNDWVVFIDPDERIDISLSNQIQNQFINYLSDDRLGAIMVPWQFYFNRHKLTGTVWGGINKKYFLVHKHRFEFKPIVHYGRKLLPTFSQSEIKFDGHNNVLHHYWMNNLSVFVQKHRRYLINEGKDQFDQGLRYNYKQVLSIPFTEFYYCFITRKGFKDLFLGLGLSVFWAFYKTFIAIDIYLIQKRINHHKV